MISPENSQSQPAHNPALVALADMWTDSDRDEMLAILAERGAQLPPDLAPAPVEPTDNDTDDLFPDEETALEFVHWERSGLYFGNTRHIDALEWAGVKPGDAETASRMLNRLGDGAQGWTRTVEEWMKDIRRGEKSVTVGRDALIRLKLVRVRRLPTGKYRMTLNRRGLTAFLMRYRKANGLMPQGLAGQNPQNCGTENAPVDNSVCDRSVSAKVRNYSRSFAGSLNGVNTSFKKPETNPPTAYAVGTRGSGDDDEENATSEPNDSANAIGNPLHVVDPDYQGDGPAQSDLQRAVAILDEVIARHDVPVAPGAVSSLCQRHGITPDVATALAQKADGNAQPIRTFSWFDTVAPGVRDKLREAKPRGHTTPVGVHASHLPNDTLARMDAFDREDRERRKRLAEGGTDDPAAVAAIAELRGKLHYGNRKG